MNSWLKLTKFKHIFGPIWLLCYLNLHSYNEYWRSRGVRYNRVRLYIEYLGLAKRSIMFQRFRDLKEVEKHWPTE